MHQKAKDALQKFNDLLPFSIAAKITSVSFVQEASENFNTNRRVVRVAVRVNFTNGREIILHDIDSFPSDADLGRIALECD